MIKRSDGKIGIREFTSMILLSVGLKFTDTTPSILIVKGLNAAWMIPIISFAVICFPFFILLTVLKKHPGKGLMELLFELMGSYIGVAIGMLLFLMTLVATVVNSRSYIDIINTMVYQRTPIPALYAMFMLAVFFVANRGFETIGRSAWIVIPYIELFVVILIVLVWHDVDWFHLFPIEGPGITTLLQEGVSHSSIYAEMILLTVFAPFLRTFKDFRKASWIGFGFCCFKLAVMMAVYVSVFDYPAVRQLAYPFQQLTRTASIAQIITHMESIFLAFWLITSVIHFAIYTYLLAFLLARSLKLDEFEPLILPLSGLVFLLGLLPENIHQVNAYWDLLIRSSTSVFLVLPIALWLMDRWRRRATP